MQPQNFLRFYLLLIVLLFGASKVFGQETNTPPWESISHYQEKQIEGWRVLVNEKLVADTNLCDRVMKLMDAQLYQITRVVATNPLAQLRKIPIWIEAADPRFPCACYHESADWLRENGVNPEKQGAVEIANPKNFLTWTHDQPWMVLHELAHGYHQRFLGDNHAGIRNCFEKAKASGKYESILRISGQKERHYAMNNEKEYFAEMTEAFFGTNDFYPFVRAELKEFDPAMYAVLCDVWETGEKPKP